MSGVQKEKIKKILGNRDFEGLNKWIEKARAPLRVLFSLTYDEDEITRWRAIEAVGKAAKAIAKRDIEKIRTVIRGLMWLMNDESGGIGWHAPEAVAEILVNVPELMDEYAALLPQYLDEESFALGACSALARIAELKPEIIRSHVDRLINLLGHPNPQMRAFSLIAICNADIHLSKRVLDDLVRDGSGAKLYDFDSGELVDATVGRLALQMIESNRIYRNSINESEHESQTTRKEGDEPCQV
jgi:hypothetical protein